MKHDKITQAVDYDPSCFRSLDRDDIRAAVSVWVDRVIGIMGGAPAEYSKFGWIADERDILEDILQVAFLLARGCPTLTRNPARILYRLTKADTSTAIMSHTVTVCQNTAGRVVLEWQGHVREMG